MLPTIHWYSSYFTYFLFALPALLLGLYAQARVKSAFNKFSQVQNYTGLTGAQVARRVLGFKWSAECSRRTDQRDAKRPLRSAGKNSEVKSGCLRNSIHRRCRCCRPRIWACHSRRGALFSAANPFHAGSYRPNRFLAWADHFHGRSRSCPRLWAKRSPFSA